MSELTSFFAYFLKIISTLLIIYAICYAVTSPMRSNKARSIVAILAFVPMGLIAVVSFAQSLSTSNGTGTETVALWAGIAAVLLSVCLSTKFGRTVLANVVGNTVYDLLKSAFSVLVGVPSALKRLFKK